MVGFPEWHGASLLFAGVVDGIGSSPLATWLTEPHKTPASRYAALANLDDPWSSREQQSWVELGIPGAKHPQSIDSGGALDTGKHTFVTEATARIPGALSAHDEPAADPYIPLCPNGTPELAPVWTAMLALSAGAATEHITAAC
jgi:hypothetical protein